MKHFNILSKLAILSTLSLSSISFAQIPDHPRVNEVDQRLNNQHAQIQQGVANGTINPRQAAKDENRLNRIAAHAQRDEARHNGHLTAREQRRLNRHLNKSYRHIARQQQRTTLR